MNCPHCGEPIPLNLMAQEMGKTGGSRTSPRKAETSRINGMKGGRLPKKRKGKKR